SFHKNLRRPSSPPFVRGGSGGVHVWPAPLSPARFCHRCSSAQKSPRGRSRRAPTDRLVPSCRPRRNKTPPPDPTPLQTLFHQTSTALALDALHLTITPPTIPPPS